MRLLICTQAVDENDPVLGFFVRWIEEFAKHAEQVEVVCLRAGAQSLPVNVRAHTLAGKGKLARAYRLILLSWRLRGEYDTVFVHMNPEYLIVAGPLWRLLGKRVALWYLHKAVNFRLRLGVFFAETVFTASPMSMRLPTRKKVIVGHGIDLPAFPLLVPPATASRLSFLTMGRLSAAKRVDVLIDAMALLHARGIRASLTVAGAPATPLDEEYAAALHERCRERGVADTVRFVGAIRHARLAELLRTTHLFLHASATGSLDKTPLEALAAGVPVVTTNPEFEDIPGVLVTKPDPEAFADAIAAVVAEARWEDATKRVASRAFIESNYALPGLIGRLCRLMEEPV